MLYNTRTYVDKKTGKIKTERIPCDYCGKDSNGVLHGHKLCLACYYKGLG
jgi:hypothetical protein